jgi:hypothetical protein
MTWIVQFHDAFESDFDQLPEAVQDGLLAHAGLLEQLGPSSMLTAGFGGLLSPLIQIVRQFCWLAAISQAEAKNGSIGN